MVQAMLFILLVHIGVNFVGYSLAGAEPGVTTTLSAGVVASDTTIPGGITGFPGAGYLYIEGESMVYTGTTDTCPSPYAAEPECFTGVSRGQQETLAVSHSTGSIVYSEASGLLNDLSNFESRTSIDDLGNITSPWSSGTALVRFLSQSVTWDWPMFEGGFAIFRIFGAIFTIAITIGIFGILAGILTNAIRSVRP